MNPRYPAVARRAMHVCEYCRAPEVIFNLPFEVEHIEPQAREGTNDEGNLALACRSCNLYKADSVTGVDDTTKNEARLFNPRLDEWDKHFAANIENGTLHGTTPVGRATVATLRMNRSVQIQAWLLWIRLGLFP